MAAKIKKTTDKTAILPRVCLVGFMGAGKTSAARELAEIAGAAWVDLDEFIEARENRVISQIVENLGESVFREIETDALREVLFFEPTKIIALGGGTWTIAENREIINGFGCRTVWLDADFELCWRRIADTDRFLAKNKKNAQQLFAARREIYETAEIHLKIKENQNVAAEIKKAIQKKKSKRAVRIDKSVASG